MAKTPEHWVSERTTIDFLIVADRAEGVNGKLYMLGGGWDRLSVVDFNEPVAFSLAIGILVPRNDTNLDQQFSILIESEDGTPVSKLEGIGFNMGRPPSAIPGQSFRSMIAINGNWKFPGPGAYRIIARLSNGEQRWIVLYTATATQLQAVERSSE